MSATANTPPRRPWTVAEVRRAVALYEAGLPLATIAAKLQRGISPTHHAIRGASKRYRCRPWLPADESRLLALRAEGQTYEAIGVVLKRTAATCRQRAAILRRGKASSSAAVSPLGCA